MAPKRAKKKEQRKKEQNEVYIERCKLNKKLNPNFKQLINILFIQKLILEFIKI